MASMAFFTAMPFRSAPDDAAVAEVFGTFAVFVATDTHMCRIDPELRGSDAADLGVQSLPHLDAAMTDEHRAVRIDVDERAGLIQEGRRERDAELDRRECEAALLEFMSGVECVRRPHAARA